MYFDFEDYRPDISPVGRAISWREGVLISIIAHLVGIIVLLLLPRLFPYDVEAARARALAVQQQPKQDSTRFVFVQPRIDKPAPKPPPRAEPSDIDRQAEAPRRAEKPVNPLPYARGNSPERTIEDLQRRQAARGRGPTPDPAAGQTKNPTPPESPSVTNVPESQSALQLPNPRAPQPQNGADGRSTSAGGSLGDALRNLQKYVQHESFDNQGGGGGQFGPEIQFDTKGVEFGPWIRRFVAQVKRNWFIPYAAMSMKGHVVITFNVHKDGAITDLAVVGPCPIEAFNNAAYGALAASNPTQPLPSEYPSDRAFFTVTFFYNETPR
jgi:TonB family protein